jgi:uncharacterized protein (TIGR03067 family)
MGTLLFGILWCVYCPVPQSLPESEIVGNWTVVRVDLEDRLPFGDAFPEEGYSLVISQSSISNIGGEGRDLPVRYAVNPSSFPKAIDCIDDGEIIKGIYALDGDSLRICLANYPEQARPTDFKARAGRTGQAVLHLRKRP